MSAEMSDEEFQAKLREFFPENKAKRALKAQRERPKVVAAEGKVLRPAEVRVSPADPNAGRAVEGVVAVRPDVVTIRTDLMEQQLAARAANRAERRAADPMRLGHWGGWDD